MIKMTTSLEYNYHRRAFDNGRLLQIIIGVSIKNQYRIFLDLSNYIHLIKLIQSSLIICFEENCIPTNKLTNIVHMY